MSKSMTPKEQLKTRTTKIKGGCTLWNGSLSDGGYGLIYYSNKRFKAHRVSYEIYIGKLPEGSVVHHICGVRNCVAVKHLQAITPQQNVAEMLERNYYIKRINELEIKINTCSCSLTTESDTK